jgi:G:T-mismatch repair DNA endonuclease (very short patch repair protein)
MSRALKGRVIPQEQRDQISATMMGRSVPATVRMKIRAAMKERCANGSHKMPDNRGRRCSQEKAAKIAASLRGRARPVAVRRKLSVASTAAWCDEKRRANMLEARKMKPNKLEASLIPLMQRFGFRYTGDGSHWIHRAGASRNPDFKRNGSRVIVDIWGDYWHRGEDAAECVAWYAASGYVALVIWESQVRAGGADAVAGMIERLLTTA